MSNEYPEVPEFVTDLFEDSYPEDDPSGCNFWNCVKCSKEFVDPEDYPRSQDYPEVPREVRMYWLSITECLCENCAVETGIPAIDKE